MARWAGSLIALAFCSMLVAGCGDDDEGPPLSTTPTVTYTAAPPTASTTTPTSMPAPTVTATASPAASNGPMVSYFGLARADSSLLEPSGITESGIPYYVRPNGSGFTIVVEGRPGANGNPVGLSTQREDAADFPDLQIVASQQLGDGTAAVCDIGRPTGGVPAINPPTFEPLPPIIAAVNDLACRFRDGEGHPMGVGPNDACTQFPSGEFEFVNNSSTVQYCAVVARAFVFPQGDTILTVRLRDINGIVGPSSQLLVRVLPPPTAPASATPTPTVTPPTEVGPVITYLGITRADSTLVEAADISDDGVPIYLRRAGFGFSLVVEGKPGRSGAAVSPSAYQSDLVTFPDLLVEVSRNLGNGSPSVCDLPSALPGATPEPGGGVPATDPADFGISERNIAAVNDFSCRFRDGQDQPTGRTRNDACVLFPSGEYGFVNTITTLQFCAFVDSVISFPVGDTTVTVRLRDVNGNVGPARTMIIRVS